jgi:hypothetical protein
MTPEARRHFAEARETEPLRWMYLSFADDDGFRGAVVIRAHGIADASHQCHLRGINPGGQVLAADIPDDKMPPIGFRNRLLQEIDIVKFWPDSKSLGEWKAEENRVPIDAMEVL